MGWETWGWEFMSQTTFLLFLYALQLPHLLLYSEFRPAYSAAAIRSPTPTRLFTCQCSAPAYSAAATTTAEATPNFMATHPTPEAFAVAAGVVDPAISCTVCQERGARIQQGKAAKHAQ